jgi:putative flippase GtrA
MSFLFLIDRVLVSLILLVFKDEGQQKAIHQFAKFCIIGVVNTLVDFGIYFLLTRFTGLRDYIYVANTISFIIAATSSYYANRSWTFQIETKPEIREAAKFYGTAVSGFIINMATFFVCVSIFGWFDLFGKILATAVAIGWNFLVTKFWVFKTKKI